MAAESPECRMLQSGRMTALRGKASHEKYH
jgi:hypothetical protein